MRSTRTTGARLGVVALCLVLAGSACGGDSDSSDVADDPPADAEEPAADEPAAVADEPAAADDEPAAPPDDAPAGTNIAVVTIGGTTYEVDVTPDAIHRCDPDFFGAFWAIGGAGLDQGIELLLPPSDDPNFTDPAAISVRDDATGVEWIADPSQQLAGVEPGESQVDDYTVDGTTASGSATFVELNATYAFQGGSGPEPEPVTGTFQVACGDG